MARASTTRLSRGRVEPEYNEEVRFGRILRGGARRHQEACPGVESPGPQRGEKADNERAVLDAVAEMPKADRMIAERIHALITEKAPELLPRTWYGMLHTPTRTARWCASSSPPPTSMAATRLWDSKILRASTMARSGRSCLRSSSGNPGREEGGRPYQDRCRLKSTSTRPLLAVMCPVAPPVVVRAPRPRSARSSRNRSASPTSA